MHVKIFYRAIATSPIKLFFFDGEIKGGRKKRKLVGACGYCSKSPLLLFLVNIQIKFFAIKKGKCIFSFNGYFS